MDSHPAGLQMQLRQNNEELTDYLKDLDDWEEEMKEKDQSLSKNKSILKETLPPVRSGSSSDSTSQKQKKRKKQATRSATATSGKCTESTRIRSYDYKAWDHFDVDMACEQVDYEVRSSSGDDEEGERSEEREQELWSGGQGESEEGSSEDEEIERQRRLAVTEKEKGNTYYKEGNYESAVECYSQGMLLDPLSAALPANRAMALMKLERYGAVEEDCNTALALQEDYVKAYLRRGVARRHLGKYKEAIHDFEQVLRLEPANKQGSSELKTTQQMKEDEERRTLLAQGHVFPVKRPIHLRSKKALKRITITDIEGEVERTTADVSAPSMDDQLSAATEIDDIERHGVPSPSTSKRSSTSDQSSVIGSDHDSTVKVLPDLVGKDDSTEATGVCVSGGGGQRGEVSAPDDVGSSQLPPIPETSFELQSHWKQLRNSQPQLVAYFKRLSPSTYPVLLQQSLETDVFSDIISILKEDSTRQELDCVEVLTWLTKVARFSVALMFLSKTDKNNLKNIFVGLLKACNSDHGISTLKKLSTQFSIKL